MTCEECENFRPKRKQTGWVCRACERAACYCTNPRYLRGGADCVWTTLPANWVPFYGKVVE